MRHVRRITVAKAQTTEEEELNLVLIFRVLVAIVAVFKSEQLF